MPDSIDTPGRSRARARHPARSPNGAWQRLLVAILHPGPALRIGASVLCLALVVAMFWLGSQPGASKFIPTPPWDRLLHFVVYGGYATLAWVGFGGRRWLAPALVAIAIGFLDEGLQSLAPGRTADWTDIAADVAGALVAVAVLGALRRSFRSPEASAHHGTRL